jgi:hypothetical protein
VRRPLAIASALATAVLAGCGASGPSDPVELVPSNAAFYGEATIKPEGDQKDAVDSLLRKLPGGGDPGQRIGRLLERAFRESDSGLSYRRDVEPWLGDKAAFFVSAPGGRSQAGQPGPAPAAAALIATEEEDAAKDAVQKAARGRGDKRTHRGVEYTRVDDESAAGTVEGWLVVGNDAGFRRAVDAAENEGGVDPLGDSEQYDKALEGVPEDHLAHVYSNLRRLFESARGGIGGAVFEPFARVFRDPYVLTVDADPDGIELATTLPKSSSSFFLPLFGKGTDLIEQLPSDSWAALAQPELGRTIGRYVDLFASGIGGRDVVEQQLRQQTGLDLQRDVVGWMGDFGVFVRGTSVSGLSGALVIETSDEAASERALRAVERELRREGEAQVGRLTAPGGGTGFTVRDSDVPQPVHVFQRSGRVVVAYGDAGARDAIETDSTLGASDEFSSAAQTLGGDFDVSTYVAIAPILRLVDSTGAATSTEWQQAKPYLEPLGALVSGTKESDGKLESRLRLTAP